MNKYENDKYSTNKKCTGLQNENFFLRIVYEQVILANFGLKSSNL